jgi:hypothetical protein
MNVIQKCTDPLPCCQGGDCAVISFSRHASHMRPESVLQHPSPMMSGVILFPSCAASFLRSPLDTSLIFMLVFALGESIPSLLLGLLVGRAGPFLRRIHRYTAVLYYVGAVVMIFVGISLVFGPFSTSA